MSPYDSISRLGLPAEFPAFFPPHLEQYRRSLAEAADTPDEYGVAYMLAAGATAVGANVSACVQPGWCVRANMFMAVIGPKGSGKTTLRNKVLAPLVAHEDELREQSSLDYDDEDFDEDDDDSDGGARRRAAKPPEPCVLVNDCTGPAVLRLLEYNRRQLLANVDELSTIFIRNTGGTDRQMWCELYDGHRRRQQRASTGGLSVTLAAPYVCILGGIQPDLLKSMYSSRGDDGLLDRLLLVGDRTRRETVWPRDADNPTLNAAWDAAIGRMVHMEALATDAIGDQVEVRFLPDAIDTFLQLMRRLNDVVALIRVPDSQYGIVAKLRQHAVKLALLHRCFRWAAGEFGEDGPLGDIDADDAHAACEATLFFFGRWLIWRPELLGVDTGIERATVGLTGSPGHDPALLTLADTAAGAQAGIRLIERLVRHLRHAGTQPINVPALTANVLFSSTSPDDLRNACSWLVDQGYGKWLDEYKAMFCLSPLPKTPTTRRRRQEKESLA